MQRLVNATAVYCSQPAVASRRAPNADDPTRRGPVTFHSDLRIAERRAVNSDARALASARGRCLASRDQQSSGFPIKASGPNQRRGDHILPLTSLIEPTLKSTSVTVEARPTAPRFSLASRISAAPGARGRQQRSSARRYQLRHELIFSLWFLRSICSRSTCSSRQRNRGYP
jgi:hypothetical protein